MKKISLVTTKNNVTLQNAMDSFLLTCKVKNLTPLSIESYEQKISHFISYCGKDKKVADISPDTIAGFIIQLRNRGDNDITINSYLRSVRALLYYCMEKGLLTSYKIKLIKAEKKIKETYTNEELEKLLVKPDLSKCSFSYYKTYVFINYLIATGNRISTAMNVQIRDLNFNDGYITLKKTKNRRQQIIPLSATLSNILREYLVYRAGDPEDYLFCDEYGNKGNIRTYQQLVMRYNKIHGVEKTSCHLFRHTFAKNWIISGGDVFRLQKILGHSSISVTKEYVEMFGQDLQQDFERFNILDNIKKKRKKIKM